MRRVDTLKFTGPKVPEVENPRDKHVLRSLAALGDCAHEPLKRLVDQWIRQRLPDTRTNTEKANQEFFDRVRRLAGIAQVEACGGATIGEKSFVVYLEKQDLDAEYGIYELKGEMLDRYPGARIDVVVLKRRPGQ